MLSFGNPRVTIIFLGYINIFLRTACTFDIHLYFTPLGQAKQFDRNLWYIESPLWKEFVYFCATSLSYEYLTSRHYMFIFCKKANSFWISVTWEILVHFRLFQTKTQTGSNRQFGPFEVKLLGSSLLTLLFGGVNNFGNYYFFVF